ncbi:hypothetical protein GWI33_005969 [Rhynchophorus ferrugineus]|uniref:Pumilio n=1 Tax=Rhynchophorus ferrugineus TaxID=354439 RepID=A0A834IYA1_RHYFE|nr:hypothetical protein GWI33_005969 [Rhynchophorus ferrugineus]
MSASNSNFSKGEAGHEGFDGAWRGRDLTQTHLNGSGGCAEMIAPSAKKLWGLEAKDGKSLALNHLNHEGVWRDPTWAAPGEHAVTAPLAMGGRRGGFPGAAGDPGGILSPRGSDGPGGLGVKMVEYVLGTSPTGDKSGQAPGGLEQRMRVLHLDDKDQKDGGKSQQSPKDVQDQGVNGQVAQQQVNGQDDDKGFNRTPGGISGLDPATMGLIKQPPPVEGGGGGGPLHPHQHALHHLPPHHALGPHLGVTLAESVNQQFADHFADTQQAAAGQGYDQTHQQFAAQQQHQVENAVLQQQQQHNFDVQASPDLTACGNDQVTNSSRSFSCRFLCFLFAWLDQWAPGETTL